MNWERIDLRLNWESSGRIRYRHDPRALAPLRHTSLADHDLWYVWAGRGRLRLRQGWITFEPGVCVWARPGWTYDTEQDNADPLGLTYLHFELLDARGQPLRLSAAELPPEVLAVEDPAFVEAVTRQIADYCAARQAGVPDESGDRLAAMTVLLRGLLLALATRLPRAAPAGGGAPVVRELMRRVHTHPDLPHSVRELARESGYTRQYLNRLFHGVTGMSTKQYLVATRIARARQRLAAPDVTVAQVAAECGYDDPLYFSRQFRRVTGRSPSAFRSDQLCSGVNS